MQQGFGVILLAEEIMRERRMEAAKIAAAHRLRADMAGERSVGSSRVANGGRTGGAVAPRRWSVRVPFLRLRVTIESAVR